MSLVSMMDPNTPDLYTLRITNTLDELIIDCPPTWKEEEPRNFGGVIVYPHSGFYLRIVRRCYNQPIIGKACIPHVILSKPDFFVELKFKKHHFQAAGGVRFFNTDRIDWEYEGTLDFSALEFQLLCTPYAPCDKTSLFNQSRANLYDITSPLEQLLLLYDINTEFSMFGRMIAAVCDEFPYSINGVNIAPSYYEIRTSLGYDDEGFCIRVPLIFLKYVAIDRIPSESLCLCQLEDKLNSELPIILNGEMIEKPAYIPFIILRNIAQYYITDLFYLAGDQIPGYFRHYLAPIGSLMNDLSKYLDVKSWYENSVTEFLNPEVILPKSLVEETKYNNVISFPPPSMETKLRIQKGKMWVFDLDSKFSEESGGFTLQFWNPSKVTYEFARGETGPYAVDLTERRTHNTSPDVFRDLFISKESDYGPPESLGKMLPVHLMSSGFKGPKLVMYNEGDTEQPPLEYDSDSGYYYIAGNEDSAKVINSVSNETIAILNSQICPLPDGIFDITAYSLPNDLFTTQGVDQNGIQISESNIIEPNNYTEVITSIRLKGKDYIEHKLVSPTADDVIHPLVRADLPNTVSLIMNYTPPVLVTQRITITHPATAEIRDEDIINLGDGRSKFRYLVSNFPLYAFSDYFHLESPHGYDYTKGERTTAINDSIIADLDVNYSETNNETLGNVALYLEYDFAIGASFPSVHSNYLGSHLLTKDITENGIVNVSGSYQFTPLPTLRIVVEREIGPPLEFTYSPFGHAFVGDKINWISNYRIVASSPSGNEVFNFTP